MPENIRIENASLIPIQSLTPSKGNPRRGNVDMIAGMLAVHGQHSPIVIDQHNTILAGHHVVLAAKQLGWTEVAAVQVNADAKTARKILLTDNRISDLAANDNAMLLALLEALPDLTGTGFGPADIDALDLLVNAVTEPPEPSKPDANEPDLLTGPAEVRIGPLYVFKVQRDPFEAWRDTYMDGISKGWAVRHLKGMLDWPKPPRRPKEKARVTGTFETVPIDAVECHPTNPREGDIGAIIESLRTLGQYKPITANRRTNRIVIGNHRYVAARTLGWTEIAVNWIDVDAEQEMKILLSDNRASDFATYDADALKALLVGGDLEGTGYSTEDAAEIVGGGATRPGPPPTGQTTIVIDDYRWKCPTDEYDQWAEVPRDIIGLLGLPYNAIMED